MIGFAEVDAFVIPDCLVERIQAVYIEGPAKRRAEAVMSFRDRGWDVRHLWAGDTFGFVAFKRPAD